MELLDFPQALATQLGISLFAGQILASIIFLMFPLLPTLAFTKNFFAILIVGLSSMGFCVALGWLPVWFIVIIGMGIALMFAGQMRDFLSGGD